ncbi:MAG: hypothetical protein ABI771_06080 [Betaproteobacteria bacterium]
MNSNVADVFVNLGNATSLVGIVSGRVRERRAACESVAACLYSCVSGVLHGEPFEAARVELS